MNVTNALQKFYTENNFPSDGGKNQKYFSLQFKFFTLKVPNFPFRKKAIIIHDIQHILYDCDTTWKGESFIAGWEVSTKIWKRFPLGLISLWAMAFSLFNYPKEVLNGYKEGLKSIGIIDLKMSEEELLSSSTSKIKRLITKNNPKSFNWIVFIFWCLISQFIFLFPLLLLFVIYTLI